MLPLRLSSFPSIVRTELVLAASGAGAVVVVVGGASVAWLFVSGAGSFLELLQAKGYHPAKPISVFLICTIRWV